MSALVRVFEFEGRELVAYSFRGRPCWIAQDVGASLGYDEKGFGNSLREWRDELIDGKDFRTLRGQDLREFKAVLGANTNLVFTSNLTILFESGVDLVCLKTTMQLGKKLRRFFADVVMPGLRRGTLEPSRIANELIELSLRLKPSQDSKSIWETETVNHLCRLHGLPAWDRKGSMPQQIARSMGDIYLIVLGEPRYRELKRRNPDPRDGTLNYQFLTESCHKVMLEDMRTVSAFLRVAKSRQAFFGDLSFAFKRADAIQTRWG